MQPATIGPFRIERELGRGGMGVVYLAMDTKLDRHVAIKALPADLGADPDRLARFQREAKVLASLSHPNIGAIHGLETAGANQYLVLEFIDGETLLNRLEAGPIPIEETLGLARQIAEALEAAHDKGIVHRDLKPGNVMVTPDGVAKVLDFGLARTAEGSLSSTRLPAAPDSPTMPVHSPTIPGAIMGSAGYMSPEQARGKPVDKRSDIFSFGCVLYEMLTGAGPFHGETVTDSLGAILHREPEWNLLPPNVPARIRELLRACLTKDRRNRLHDIGDARIEIERAIGAQEWSHAATPGGAPGRRIPWGIAAVAGLVLLGAGWVLGRALVPQAAPLPSQSFHVSVTVPETPTLQFVSGIAPDASFVVYTAWKPLEADSLKPGGVLVVRRLDRDEINVIDSTEGAIEAALSPDGRWLAFVAARDRALTKATLKKIALNDGQPVGSPETLCELPSGGYYAMCWSSDREIVLTSVWQKTLLAVPAAGGEPRVVLREELGTEIDNWGELRPLVPGKSIVATRWSLVGQTIKESAEVIDLASGERTQLLANAGGAQLVGGDLIVARRNLGSFIAARFDPDTARVIGEPVTVLTGGIRSSFYISQCGTLARPSSTDDVSSRKLVWLDEQGQPQPIAAPPRPYGSTAFSPDSGRLLIMMDAVNDAELTTEMWVYDLSRRTFTRIATPEPILDVGCWSPDALRISYGTISNDAASVWIHRSDGSGVATKIYADNRGQTLLIPMTWSPDGKCLAVVQVDLTKNTVDMILLEEEAGSALWVAKPYLNSPANEDSLRFSPDGKWISFVSDESGRGELYVQRFTGAGNGAEDAKSGRTQVSTNGLSGTGWWSADGKELRYFDTDMQLMRADVQTEPAFAASVPKSMFSIKEYDHRSANAAPDGRLMLILKGENERATRIDLVVNFMDEVRTKMSAANQQ